jgi:hypothetical protein
METETKPMAALKPYVNPNPRIGIVLRQGRASARLRTVLWRFRLRGLVWLGRTWPEERMRRELRGYGAKTSREWSAIVTKRLATGRRKPETENAESSNRPSK